MEEDTKSDFVWLLVVTQGVSVLTLKIDSLQAKKSNHQEFLAHNWIIILFVILFEI